MGRHEREIMVTTQIAARGICDPHVLEAMRAVPREAFCSADQAVDPLNGAYADRPLPIGEDQTLSQPYIVALMAELMQLGPSSRILEVGTGCGYAAAVFATIVTAGDVFTIERHDSLVMSAAQRLTALGYDNVHIRHGDGRRGWPEAAPFDAIAVAAAAEGDAPPELLRQLKLGGRLVIPIGKPEPHDAQNDDIDQILFRITRTGPDSFRKEDMGAVRFVPLVG